MVLTARCCPIRKRFVVAPLEPRQQSEPIDNVHHSLFLNRARAVAQLGALAIATLAWRLLAGMDTPLVDDVGSAPAKLERGVQEPQASLEKAEPQDQSKMRVQRGPARQAKAARPAPGVRGRSAAPAAWGARELRAELRVENAGAPAVCGNNKLEAGEECDDGNTKDWDGCTSTCKSRCEQCEKQYCVTPSPSREDYFLNCFTDLGSVSNPISGKSLAEQGPARGQPKQKLCAKLVECLRRTNCGQDGEGSMSRCLLRNCQQ
ncbi:MAG: hypothetical protein WDO74_31765 [Pseudomonadota bacterium]